MSNCQCKDNKASKGLYDKFTVVYNETGETVTRFVFPLIPERDPYANVALIAYANAVAAENPKLARDIKDKLAHTGRYGNPSV